MSNHAGEIGEASNVHDLSCSIHFLVLTHKLVIYSNKKDEIGSTHARNLLVGGIVDKVGKENAKGDIQLEKYIQCSTYS